ncbi:MAG: hypothetical protein WA894_19940, partial [Candidatus Acidiferrum sp.]
MEDASGTFLALHGDDESNGTTRSSRQLKNAALARNLVLGHNFLTFALQFGGADVSFPQIPAPGGGAMSDGADRREARRFNMTLPMR